MDDNDTLRLPDYYVGDDPQTAALNSVNYPQTLSQDSGFSGLFNSITGVLSKTVETAEDVLAMQGANKLVGAVYPNGDTNPDKNASIKTQVKPAFDYKPWIIGGAAVLGVILIVAVVARKS